MARKTGSEKAAEIVDRFRAFEKEHHDLWSRMDEDLSLDRLEEWLPEDSQTEGYKTFTSNDPQTVAKKIRSWVAGAEVLARVPYAENKAKERTAGDLKEKFFYGALRSADDRRLEMVENPLHADMTWYVVHRGQVAVRALLMKNEDGETCVDITPYDPRNTAFGTGAHGLEWICFRLEKRKADLKSLYPKLRLNEEEDSHQTHTVYDYYDRVNNTIVMDGRELKQPEPHGAGRVPCVFVRNHNMPDVFTSNGDTKPSRSLGESVFESIRDTAKEKNEAMSVFLELSRRHRRQPVVITSPDGTATLDEDLWKEGSEVSVPEGTKIVPLPFTETTKDAAVVAGLLDGELQRGSLPHSVFGELQFQLSGFAINSLKQGVESVLSPVLDTLGRAYTGVARLLVDQYLSNAYGTVTMSGYTPGRDRKRAFFSEEIKPDAIRKSGELEISLVAQLPEDDMTKYGLAQIAREGSVPLLSDRRIRDRVLGLRDAEDEDDAIKEQIAERALPEAGLFTIMQALEEKERPEMAQLYLFELTRLYAEKFGQMPQMLGGGGPGQPGAAPPQQVGLNPGMVPPAAMGVPAPAPTPQAGPLVPQGQPRPGAVSDQQQLNAMGLFGPRQGE